MLPLDAMDSPDNIAGAPQPCSSRCKVEDGPSFSLVGKTVLVVDDQPMVLGVVQRMLQRHGIQTLASSSAAAALEILADDDQSVALLLTDVRMPDQDGVELVTRARHLRPKLPVLFMSAYPDYEGDDLLPGKLLSKPFSRTDLKQAVCEVMTAARTEAGVGG